MGSHINKASVFKTCLVGFTHAGQSAILYAKNVGRDKRGAL